MYCLDDLDIDVGGSCYSSSGLHTHNCIYRKWLAYHIAAHTEGMVFIRQGAFKNIFTLPLPSCVALGYHWIRRLNVIHSIVTLPNYIMAIVQDDKAL